MLNDINLNINILFSDVFSLAINDYKDSKGNRDNFKYNNCKGSFSQKEWNKLLENKIDTIVLQLYLATLGDKDKIIKGCDLIHDIQLSNWYISVSNPKLIIILQNMFNSRRIVYDSTINDTYILIKLDKDSKNAGLVAVHNI